MVNKGGRHVLGPGGVFSFLQGQHRCSIQFIDSTQIPLTQNSSEFKDVNVKGCRVSSLLKGLKSTKSLSDLKANAETESQLDTDIEMAGSFSADQTSRKRKSEEKDENKTSSLKKLRRSLTGHLTDCFSPTERRKYNVEDLQYKFADGISKEAEEPSTKSNQTVNNSSLNENNNSEKNIEAVQQHRFKHSISEYMENKWVTKDGLMVFCCKGVDAREKVSNRKFCKDLLKKGR